MNLHQLLATPGRQVYLSFEHAFSVQGHQVNKSTVDITDILGEQRRFYGNHLMKKMSRTAIRGGLRVVRSGDFLFNNAMLYVKVNDTSYRLAEERGFLELSLETDTLYHRLRKEGNSFRSPILAIATFCH